jgi:hypothetical protein
MQQHLRKSLTNNGTEDDAGSEDSVETHSNGSTEIVDVTPTTPPAKETLASVSEKLKRVKAGIFNLDERLFGLHGETPSVKQDEELLLLSNLLDKYLDI